MTALVRKQLIPLLNATLASDHPNVGLLIQRGLRVWDTSDKEKADKKNLIEVITNTQPSDLYQLAFDRWLLQTEQKDEFATVSASLDGRLMTGLALGGTLETGVTTHHSYGMPLLAGSSVKGAVRAYAESIFLLKDAEGKIVLDEKGKTQINPAMKDILNVLFGADEDAEQANAGYLVWHDAWLIPTLTKEGKYSSSEDAKPFAEEIVTVHHSQYYADKTGKVEALDMEAPVPNQQLAVQGSFYFVIEGKNKQWLDFAKQLLENMLNEFGMGAKGAAGYGYFKEDAKLNEQLQAHFNLINIAPIDPNDEYAIAKQKISIYSEVQLYEALAKSGRTKSFADYGLDKTNEEHCRVVVEIALEKHQHWIESDAWTSSKSKTIVEALKFVNKYKS